MPLWQAVSYSITCSEFLFSEITLTGSLATENLIALFIQVQALLFTFFFFFLFSNTKLFRFLDFMVGEHNNILVHFHSKRQDLSLVSRFDVSHYTIWLQNRVLVD